MGMARADISCMWGCEKMRNSETNGKKPIEEVEGVRPRKAKLERVSRDTSERKQTEQLIEQLAKFPSENPYPVLRVSGEGKVLYANQASKLVLEGRNSREGALAPADWRRMAEEALKSGSVIRIEAEHKDRTFAFRVIPVVGAGYCNFYGIDITERKKAEQALRESEERFRQVAENTQEWIWEVDTNGLYTYASPLAEKILGYKLEEIVGKKHFYNLFHPEDRERLKKEAFEAFAKKESFREFINRNVHKTGQIIWLSTSGVPILDERGNLLGYRGADADITERKRAEKELLDYQMQLKSLASQLTLTEERERRRIAADLHDQISQSLVVSKIKLDTLRSSALSEDLAEELNEISDSLSQTVQDIRSLTFDLSFPVLYELGFEAAVAAWLVEQIQEKYGITTEFEDDGQPKPLDDDVRVLLFRDVRELLVNVVRHANAKKVKVSIRKVGSEIQVSVEDDGVGFDVAKVVSTSAKRGGFGFFSIRERLEELGGHLEIDSEPGYGTKVTLMAPLKQQNTKGRQK